MAFSDASLAFRPTVMAWSGERWSALGPAAPVGEQVRRSTPSPICTIICSIICSIICIIIDLHHLHCAGC